MKNLFKIIFIFLITASCKAQTVVDIEVYNRGNNSNKYFKDINNNYQKFIGRWENKTGDITFRVYLWKKTKNKLYGETNSFIDEINGNFMILKNAGQPGEMILHTSEKYYPQSHTTSTNVIKGEARNATKLSAYLEDTCASGGNDILSAWLVLTITNPGASPAIAHWQIKSTRILFEGESFTVPTDIMLTKMN